MDNVRLWQSPEGEYILVCSLKINSRLGNPTSVWAYDAGYHQSQAQPRLVMRCLSSEQGQTSSSAALHQPGEEGAGLSENHSDRPQVPRLFPNLQPAMLPSVPGKAYSACSEGLARVHPEAAASSLASPSPDTHFQSVRFTGVSQESRSLTLWLS